MQVDLKETSVSLVSSFSSSVCKETSRERWELPSFHPPGSIAHAKTSLTITWSPNNEGPTCFSRGGATCMQMSCC